MESKAEEGLNLSWLALERLIFAEAVRLARNPILMDALVSEPSLLGQMVTHDLTLPGYNVSSAVVDSTGTRLAVFGDPVIPETVLRGVLEDGRSYNFFSVDDGLTAKSAVPVRDEIYPDRVVGCAFVSRRVDDRLARQIASELGRDLSFYAVGRVAASSKRELFASELMTSAVSPDAYVACFINGRELHYSWDRVGGIDVVLGYRPLRGPEGNAVGAVSVPVVFSEGEAGRRMGSTTAAISYLIVIVICAIFIFGLLLARSISDPIRQMIRGTLRIGAGDLSFTIPKPSDDEIGDLVASFNSMTAALARSRKTLSERKRYIETIIGNVGAGIISTDPGGRIATFNAAAESILEIKARNARGRDAKRLLRRIGASGLAVILDEVRTYREVARKEVGFAARDGRSVTLRAVATVVGGPRKRVMGKVIVFEDVTELIRSKKLVAWSEMARQVAHEIKNPLTPMKLSAQHLLQARKDRVGDFDQVLEESVGIIVEQIESLRRIAVEFSQFSRMPERKLEWSDINVVVEESLGQYERAIGTSVEIVKNLNPRIPKVRIDRDEVKRVFVNIVENAVQAMPDGGTLEIVCRKASSRVADRRPDSRGAGRGYDVRASSTETGLAVKDFVEVTFSDTGTGISPANAAKLFEPNFSTKSHGTGLGLAISKGIMDAYGGEILIESKEGYGTCVSVRFPVPRQTTPRPPRRSPRRRSSGRRRRPPQAKPL
jgi:PAS domain S-box-containing protein